MAQITLNSSGVASNGSLLLQSNGTTTAVTIDTAQNMGLGVTPSAWTSFSAFQFGENGSLAANDFGADNAQVILGNNTFYDGAYKYIATGDSATRYSQAAGAHSWSTAASGTAGNTISFTQAMTLDASGNLGVGTTSPKLNANAGTFLTVSNSTSNQSGWLELQGAPSAADNPAGILSFNNSNRAGADKRIAQITGTRGSAADSGIISFSTWNAGTVAEAARITSGGDLLVGKNTASATSGDGFWFSPDGQGYVTSSYTTNSALTWRVYSTGAAAYRFYVGYGGTVYATSTTITGISDVRLKENIRDLDDGLDVVMALKPRKFDWKEGKGADIKNARGFIAQEFEAVLPDMIEEWADPAPEGEEPYKAINANLIPTLVKAIQEQQAIITQLQADVAALKGTA